MNKSIPLISVVMPVFNGEKYLAEAINSILSQTFTDFEFIIVNDGSTDYSEEIILKYTDKRIRYFYKENSGISDTLRYGIEKSYGLYIARMDADDISFANRFQKQIKFLEENTEYILVGSAIHYIDEKSNFIGRSIPYSSDFAIKYNLKFGSVIAHPSVMFKKEAYLNSHGYNSKIVGLFEDYVLWLDMSHYGKFYNLTTPLLAYRVSDKSWYFNIDQIELQKTMRIIYQLITNNRYNDVGEIFTNSKEKIFCRKVKIVNDTSRFHTNYYLSGNRNSYIINIVFRAMSNLKNLYSYYRFTISKLRDKV